MNFTTRHCKRRQKSDQWALLNLIPVPKSGDLSRTGNYKSTCLNSLVPKIYNSMLLTRSDLTLIDDHLKKASDREGELGFTIKPRQT